MLLCCFLDETIEAPLVFLQNIKLVFMLGREKAISEFKPHAGPQLNFQIIMQLDV